MYLKVEYASWLKATYGLSESIRELVPSLKVPPSWLLLELDPPHARGQDRQQEQRRRGLPHQSALPGIYSLNAGSSTFRLRMSASSVQRTPSGREARCFPCPSGSL